MNHRSLFCCADSLRTEVFVAATEPAGELTTQEFYESRPGEALLSFMKSAAWGVTVSPGAVVFGAWSGHRRNRTEMIWTGWHDGVGLHLLSLAQEQPIAIPLGKTDLVVEPPMTMLDGTLHQFVIRDGKLLRFIASGPLNEPGTLTLEELQDVRSPLHATSFMTLEDSKPRRLDVSKMLVAAAAPVLDDQENAAVVVWIESAPAGCRVHLSRVSGSGTPQTASVPLETWVPLPRCRLAVYPGVVPSCAFAAESVTDGACAVLEVRFDLESGQIDLAEAAVDLPRGAVRAAASLFLQRSEEAIATTWLHVRDGRLLRVEESSVTLVRYESDATYDFPIITTHETAFEAVAGAEGEPVRWRLP